MKIKMNQLILLLLVGVAAIVALSPTVVYAPVPRTVLFFVMGLVPGLVFGEKAQAEFKFGLPGFALTATGVTAVVFGAAVLLTNLAAPDERIAICHFFDEEGRELSLETTAISISTDGSMKPNHYIDGHNLVMVFPEQLGEIDVTLTLPGTGKQFRGSLGYASVRENPRRDLGKEFRVIGR